MRNEAFDNEKVQSRAEKIKAWRDLYNGLKKSNSSLLKQIPELKGIEEALKNFEDKAAGYKKEEYHIRRDSIQSNKTKYTLDAHGNYFEKVDHGDGEIEEKRVNRDILLDYQRELRYRDQFAPKVVSEMTELENKMAALAPVVEKLLTLPQKDSKLSQLSERTKDVLDLPKSLKENVQDDLYFANKELEKGFRKEWSKAKALMRLGKWADKERGSDYIEGETAAWDDDKEKRRAWFVQKSQQLGKLKGDSSFQLEYLKPIADEQHEKLQLASKVNDFRKTEKIDLETALYIDEHIREIVPYEEQIELRENDDNFRVLDNEVLVMDAARWHKYQELARTEGLKAADDYYYNDDPDFPNFWEKMDERDNQLMKYMGIIPEDKKPPKEETEAEKQERLKNERIARESQMYFPEDILGPNLDAPVEKENKEPEIGPEERARLEKEELEEQHIRAEKDYPPEMRALYVQELENLYRHISLPECTEGSPEFQTLVDNTKQHLDKIKSCTNGYDFSGAMAEMCDPDGKYTASVNKMLRDTAQKSSLSGPERDRAKMLLGMRQLSINFFDGIEDPEAFTERAILGNAMADQTLEMLENDTPSVHDLGTELLKDSQYYEKTANGILECEDFQQQLEQKQIIPEMYHGETHRSGREKLNSEQAFILDSHFITDRINNVPRSFVPQSKEQNNIIPAQEATFTAVRKNRPMPPQTEKIAEPMPVAPVPAQPVEVRTKAAEPTRVESVPAQPEKVNENAVPKSANKAPDCSAYLDEMNRLWGDLKKTDFFLMRNSKEYNALRDHLKEVMPKLNKAAGSDHIAQDLAREMKELTPLINAYRNSHAPNDFSDRQMRRLKTMNRMERLAQSFEKQVTDPKADVEGMFAEKFVQNDAIRKLQGGNAEEKQHCRDILLGKTLSQEVDSFYEVGKPGAFIKGQLDTQNMASELRKNGLGMLQDMMKTNLYQSAMQAKEPISSPVLEEPEVKQEVSDETNQKVIEETKQEVSQSEVQNEAETKPEIQNEAEPKPEVKDNVQLAEENLDVLETEVDENLKGNREKYINSAVLNFDTARNLNDFSASHPEFAQETIDKFQTLSDEFTQSAEKGKPVSKEFAKVQEAFLRNITELTEAKDSPDFGNIAFAAVNNMNRAFADYRAKLEGAAPTPAQMKQMEIMCRTDRMKGRIETGFGKLNDFILEQNAEPENEVNPNEQAKESLASIKESMQDYAESDASEDASPEFAKLQEHLEKIIPQMEAKKDSPEFYKDMLAAVKELSPLVENAKMPLDSADDLSPAQDNQLTMLEEIQGEIGNLKENLRNIEIGSEELSVAARNELKESFAEKFVLASAMQKLMKDPGNESAKKTLTGETLQEDIERFHKSPLMQDSFIEKNRNLIEKAVMLDGLEMANQITQRFVSSEKKPAEVKESKKDLPAKQNENKKAQNTNAAIGGHS